MKTLSLHRSLFSSVTDDEVTLVPRGTVFSNRGSQKKDSRRSVKSLPSKSNKASFGKNYEEEKVIENSAAATAMENLLCDIDEISTDFFDRMILVQRLLRHICESHDLEMIQYMRTQPDNVRDINLVAKTAQLCDVLQHSLSAGSIPSLIQVLY